jgi:hypothetical protein
MSRLAADLSHWQGQHSVSDFRQAARRLDAVWFKSSQGTGYQDPTFVQNVQNARKAKLPVGAYHFVEQGAPKTQVKNFLGQVKKAGGVDFLVIDWEQGDRRTAVVMARTLRSQKVPVLEYRGQWARAHGGDIKSCDGAVVPQYGPAHLDKAYYPKHLPLSAWQYSDGVYNGTRYPTSIPGIGKTDLSVVYRRRHFGIKRRPVHKVVQGVTKAKDRREARKNGETT